MSVDALEHYQSRLSSLITKVESFYSRIHEMVEERKEALLKHLLDLQNSWKVASENLLTDIDSMLCELRESSTELLFTKSVTDCEENICLSFQNYFELCYPDSLPTFVTNSELELEIERLGRIDCVSTPQYTNKIYSQQSISQMGAANNAVLAVRAVKFDSEEELMYVADGGNRRIQVFSGEGDHLFNFGTGILSSPWGLCTKLSGKVLVSDEYANVVFCFEKWGNLLSKRSTGDWTPLGIDAYPEDGEIFISDFSNNRIVILDSKLKLISSFGTDFLSTPSDVQVKKDKVFVLDNSQLCVHTFSRPDYTHVTRVIEHTAGSNFFSVDSMNNIILSHTVSHCLHIYNNAGEFIHRIGWFGEKRGKLVFPTGVDCNNDWRIIVFSSKRNGPIQIF